ncbi:MAG: 3-isopropylmalate dehydratase large subunit [bacterium]
MNNTLYEKILLRNTGKSTINTGDILEINVDRAMMHDFFTPYCIDKFKGMGFTRVFNPENIIIVYDHLVPTISTDDCRHHQITEEFVKVQNIDNIYRNDGVCHQLMHEQGHVKPGDIVVGTDSHTVTYGALGVMATGIGYTEMASVLGTGKTWLKVVPTIRINIEGELSNGVYSKDIILQILKDLGTDGANYRVLEFGGSTIRNMSIDQRFTLPNMSVEAGAKAGLIDVDDKTIDYLSLHYSKDELEILHSDNGAEYERVINYRAEEIEPLAACPHNVNNVSPVSELKNITIDQAFLGSCTNGRLEDIAIASDIIEGNRIHSEVRLIVVPASRKIFQDAVKNGYIEKLINAGAIVTHPSCGLCAGRSGGVLEDGDTIIASNNRNFLGRMGGKEVQIYLASPATVVKSAIAGKISCM